MGHEGTRLGLTRRSRKSASSPPPVSVPKLARAEATLLHLLIRVTHDADEPNALARHRPDPALVPPSSPIALRTAVIRLVSADSETIRPPHADWNKSSLLTTRSRFCTK